MIQEVENMIELIIPTVRTEKAPPSSLKVTEKLSWVTIVTVVT